VNKRAKIQADIKLGNEQTQNLIEEVKAEQRELAEECGKTMGTLKLIKDLLTILHLVQTQDIEDKRQVSLMGMKTNSELAGSASTNVRSSHQQTSSQSENEKVQIGRNAGIFIDKNCISCSGNSPTVLSHIKMACLSFKNSKISYQN
jgi:hypothetical protein